MPSLPRRRLQAAAVAALVAVAAVVTGCSDGGGDKDEGTEVAPTGFGVYLVESGRLARGSRFFYTVPAPLEDYLVSRLEQFRAKVGAPAATYMLVGADLSRAASDLSISLNGTVRVVEDDGKVVEFRAAPDAITAWLGAAGVTDELRAEGQRLVLDYQLSALTLPGTVGKTALVAEGELGSVASVDPGLKGADGKPLRARRVSEERRPQRELIEQ